MREITWVGWVACEEVGAWYEIESRYARADSTERAMDRRLAEDYGAPVAYECAIYPAGRHEAAMEHREDGATLRVGDRPHDAATDGLELRGVLELMPAEAAPSVLARDEAAAAICDELGAGRYCPVSGLDAATVLAVLEWRGGIRAAVSGNPRRRGGNVWDAGDDEALRLLGFEWSERRRMWWVHCDRLGGAETAPTRQIKALAA